MLTNDDAGSEETLTARELVADRERPIFVLGAGWRTGSTLLQRLLCTHPDVIIWGENRGLMAHLEAAMGVIEGLQPLSEIHHQHREAEGANAWIAVLNPALTDFEDGIRQLLLRYYAEPAHQSGSSRWGFKEVRYGLEDTRLSGRCHFVLNTGVFLPWAVQAKYQGPRRKERAARQDLFDLWLDNHRLPVERSSCETCPTQRSGD